MAGDGEALAKDLTPEEFGRFRDYIHQHSGIFLEDQKSDSLRISLITRATRFGFSALAEYYDLLTSDENEFKELMNLVTINETSFFRFPAQFEALRTEVIPRILERKSPSSRQFRVWSAGCSTGEEPYSIAMTLLDSGLEGLGYSPEVLGTDVSTNALLKAKEAVYPARALLSVPHTAATRFFEPTAHGHRVVEKVRRIVTLQYHNLIKEPYPLALMGNWDVIFCRNVTIYFKLESTRRVVENYWESLNPGGFLFIGHSETLTSISDRFEPVELGGVFLYRKPLPRKIKTFSQSVGSRDTRGAVEIADSTRAKRRERRLVSSERSQSSTRRSVFDARTPPVVADVTREVAGETEGVEGVSGEVEALLDAARLASAEGRTEAVLEAVQRVFELDSENPQAYLLSAFAHADMGQMDSAISECNRALSFNPLLPAARYILGMIYQRQGDAIRAISELKRTIYIDSDFALAHFTLANVYRQQGAADDAYREYGNTIRALYENPDGEWKVFMGGFRPDLLAKTCERSLIECRKVAEDA